MNTFECLPISDDNNIISVSLIVGTGQGKSETKGNSK